MRNNADWLAPMGLAELLDYTRQLTVAQLLERDDFARRFAEHVPITLSEFFYPLLQGIDSVQIAADLELGGTDQTFNNLVGRDAAAGARAGRPQAVLTLPLLVGIDGVEKMGKSLNNYVAIAEPAAEQFGKLMRIPDRWWSCTPRLCTALHPQEAELARAGRGRGRRAANAAKRRVAREIVTLYHGAAEADAAEDRFDATFKPGGAPQDSPDFPLPAEPTVHLPALLVAAGLAASTSAPRRRRRRPAGRRPVPAREYDAEPDLAGRVLSVGKRKVVRLIAR